MTLISVNPGFLASMSTALLIAAMGMRMSMRIMRPISCGIKA